MILSDERFFTNGPVRSYRPNAANVARLAPPPADPVKTIPVSHQIGIQPPIKSPRIAHSRGSGAIKQPYKHRTYPNDAATCLHAELCRDGKAGGKGQKLRCTGCGTARRLDLETAERVMRREIPLPPKASTGRKLPDEHGTYRTWKRGCRCEVCVLPVRARNNRNYAKRKSIDALASRRRVQ